MTGRAVPAPCRIAATTFALVLLVAHAAPALSQGLPTPIASIDVDAEPLSPWTMIQHADLVVQSVMGGLAFASLVTWTIWLAKTMELAAARRKAGAATRRLAEADSLDQGLRALDHGWTRNGPVADLAQAAAMELRRSADLPADGVKERLAIALARIEARAGRAMARGTGVLATIGSTAPFVGLFGTVWGIMNAFIGISETRQTSLAVVAPGIAEALLATAIGLVAAIPAVIIYNHFARLIAGYRAQLADAGAELLQHVSRDLDRAHASAPPPAARRAPQLAAAE